jgi:hypothetical protein
MGVIVGPGISIGAGITMTGGGLYTPLAGSLLFNGTTQYLSLSPGIGPLSTGAYTIEGWFYNNSTYASAKGFCGTDAAGGLHLFNADTATITLDKNGGGGVRNYTFSVGTLQINKWQYIVLNRNASTQVETMWIGNFVDNSSLVTCNRATSCAGGTSISGGTQVNSLDYTGVTNWIGRYYGGYFPGYMTNFRATVGTAVYDSTSSTITAPSAPLASLANTKYLMLGAAVTTDSSGTQTVTNNNTVTQNALVPF